MNKKSEKWGVKTIPVAKKWKKWVGLGLMASMLGLGLPHGSAQAATGWTTTYYSKTNLTGNKVNGGPYSSLNFNWGNGAPKSGVPKNNFSAVFQKGVFEYAGTYDLQVRTSQGIRVYVDGKLRIDHWGINKGNYWHTPITLNKGNHSLVVKYYKTTGNASLSLNLNQIQFQTKSYSPPKLPIANDQWYGEIFPSQNLTGVPKFVGSNYSSKIPNLNFNWGKNAPISGFPKDHFSALFQRQIVSPGGNYKLNVSADDGVQVVIDNKLAYNAWNTGIHSYSNLVSLNKGNHTILVKYFENTGNANVKVDLSYVTPPVTKPTSAPPPKPVPVPTPKPTPTPAPAPKPVPAPVPTVTIPLTTTEWNGAYYPSQNLTGTAVLFKNTSFRYSWGSSAPSTKIPSGPFSAIYQKNVSFDGNPTDLEVWANNGFEVDVDGKTVMSHLTNTSDGFWHQSVNPSNGTHKVVVKYVKKNLTASLRFETGSPYRTLDLKKPSNITALSITNFFNSYNSSSPLKADAQSFIDAQNKYGVNATYLVAHAILETGWGSSLISQYKNNLYGYGAYDVCPFTCAYYFPDHTSSINLVSHDVARSYLSSTGSYYLGEYGPNLIGMNVDYASGGSWYSSIANLMEEIQPYNDNVQNYYSSVGEKQVALPSVPPYGSAIPGPDNSGNQINFPSGTNATIVNTDLLSLRSLPYVSSSTFIESIRGSVKVLGYNKDVYYDPTSTGNYKYHWYRVQYGNTTGWVYGYYLNFQNLLYVNAIDVLIRSKAGETYFTGRPTISNTYVQPVLNSAGAPTTQNGYYEIKVPNSTEIGWVPVKYTEVVKQ